jgi:2-keto-3-deoxy-L-rhamnonate aldolase RhmA
MDKQVLKRRLAAGDVTVGAWSTVTGSAVAECMAAAGFDWLAVDMEHGPASVEDARAIFLAAERHGVAPLARLPSADPYLARRLLDQGAHGLIIPVVEEVAAFGAFLDHCVYPPAGKRGVGLSRCNDWGTGFRAYLDGFVPVIVPQIETVRGAAAAAAIAAMPQVDALFLGPYDLSASLGAAGDFTSDAFKAAISGVRQACATAGKAAGIHQVEPDPAQLQARKDDGFRFIAYGTDAIALRYAFRHLAPICDE